MRDGEPCDVLVDRAHGEQTDLPRWNGVFMTAPKSLILIVEDEEDMLLGVQHNLEFEGYRTLTATDGHEGLEKALTGVADLLILDVMLPGLNGFDLLRELRHRKVHTPVILLTSKSLEADKLNGFALGADDYVTKPFSIQELLARVRAVLQRAGRRPEPESLFRFGNVEVDFEQHQVRRDGQTVPMALKEFEILHILVRHRGELVTREQMLQEVWGYERDNLPETRTVDNHIAKLRTKVGAQHIETVPKLGYRFRG
jgi:two-component system alkaline phosphatase synthesis response regulator PhoP